MTHFPLTEHIPSLRRYARVLTGDAWMADDLVQDTLERACSKWRLWVAGSDLRAWLFTLMHNIFINQARRSMRQAAAGVTVNVDDVEGEMAAPEGGTAQALDLQRCLLRLPEDQRVVLLLVSLEDLSYEEVAKITGVPVGTVMSRLSRARSRLRELMDGPAPQAAGVPTQLRRLK
jgi:RNA polymerase sigma factor (sigma-70 family)